MQWWLMSAATGELLWRGPESRMDDLRRALRMWLGEWGWESISALVLANDDGVTLQGEELRVFVGERVSH